MRNGSAAGTVHRILDTNILMYQHDPRDLRKQRAALGVVARAGEVSRTGISTQVLAEFASTATRRLPSPLTPAEAGRQVSYFALAFQVLPVTAIAIEEALRAVDRYQMAFWDALLWGVAHLNQVRVILTEDLPGGRTAIEGVHYANPLDPGFDLSRIGRDL